MPLLSVEQYHLAVMKLALCMKFWKRSPDIIAIKRDQLAELRRLMAEVDIETRQEIVNQLSFRLESLVDLINDRLEPLDMKNNGSRLSKLWSFIKLNVRIFIGKPLTKWLLKRIFRLWIRQNFLNLRNG